MKYFKYINIWNIWAIMFCKNNDTLKHYKDILNALHIGNIKEKGFKIILNVANKMYRMRDK